MNYEKLSVIKTGSNAGLYATCYFHMQVMYHNLFSLKLCFVYKMFPIMLIIIKEQEKVKRRRCMV